MPVVPGRHPLRALAAADGAVRTVAPEWAEISCAADPVSARENVLWVIAVEWQWTARSAEYARVVAASDLLHSHHDGIHTMMAFTPPGL